MRDNVLYFPYISIPNEKWTIKTLLYWDKISSIVPMEYIDEPEKLSPFMQQLVQEELVEQVFPAHYLHRIESFEDTFIQMIDHRLNILRRFNKSKARIHQGKFGARSMIHAEKLGQIPDYLIKKGLASRVDYSWYEVDKTVAKLFMAYLASCLGGIDAVNATPVTNQITFSRLFGDFKYNAKKNLRNHQEAREVILDSLLPVPSEDISLDKLVRFKSDYGHLLPPLRRKVETHCASIALLPNKEDRVLSTEQFIADCFDDVNEITEAMRPTWNNISFGSLYPLFGAGFTLHATNAGNDLAYAGAAFTFAASAYQAIASIRGNRITQEKKPLAYMVHARTGL